MATQNVRLRMTMRVGRPAHTAGSCTSGMWLTKLATLQATAWPWQHRHSRLRTRSHLMHTPGSRVTTMGKICDMAWHTWGFEVKDETRVCEPSSIAPALTKPTTRLSLRLPAWPRQASAPAQYPPRPYDADMTTSWPHVRAASAAACSGRTLWQHGNWASRLLDSMRDQVAVMYQGQPCLGSIGLGGGQQARHQGLGGRHQRICQQGRYQPQLQEDLVAGRMLNIALRRHGCRQSQDSGDGCRLQRQQALSTHGAGAQIQHHACMHACMQRMHILHDGNVMLANSGASSLP